MKDKFFEQTTCDRCGEWLNSRTMSWFNDQTIGDKCSLAERKLRGELSNRGYDTRGFEGCGFIPDLKDYPQKTS